MERLEQVLSPRVASRTLRMGVQAAGLSLDTVDAASLEPVLKGVVFRQLQVALSPDDARAAVSELLEELHAMERDDEEASDASGEAEGVEDRAGPAPAAPREAANEAPPGPGGEEPHEEGHAALDALRQEARRYALFFEWPEVREVREGLEVFAAEVAAGRRGERLEADLREQLARVHHKLEDALVVQARDLAELEEALEEARAAGAPKLRRLDWLVRHVRRAQQERQPAPAEVERARALVRELRKQAAAHEGADGAGPEAPPDALEAHFRRIDLEAEGDRLATLERDHATLLAYRSELAETLGDLRGRLEQGASVAEEIDGLHRDLQRADEAQREALRDELDAMAARWEGAEGADAEEIGRSVTMLRSVLQDGLPAHGSLLRLRDLDQLAQQRADDDDTPEGDRRAADERRRLDRLYAVERDREVLQGIDPAVEGRLDAALRAVRDGGDAADERLAEAEATLEELRTHAAERVSGFGTRLDEALARFAHVERLNSEAVAIVRRILRHLDDQRDAMHRITPGMQAQLEGSLREAEGLLLEVEDEERATREIADRLMTGNAVEDALGLFGSGPSDTDDE